MADIAGVSRVHVSEVHQGGVGHPNAAASPPLTGRTRIRAIGAICDSGAVALSSSAVIVFTVTDEVARVAAMSIGSRVE